MQERYMRLRTGVLDANENILPDLKEEVRRREDEEMTGCR
jgi:hypothetical protein